jgi:tetratricopeptide (TPR) repeat protein
MLWYEESSGRVSMHRAANIISFLTGQSSRIGFADVEKLVSAGNLFQHILLNRLADITNSKALSTHLGYEAIRLAEHAYCLRNWIALEEASVILMNLPISEIQQVGFYYQAITKYRRGQEAEAENQYKKLADSAPYPYRARALQSLGWICRLQGQLDEALRLNLEALQMASTNRKSNLLVKMWASWEIGFVKSLNGDHHQALKDLERDLPLIRAVAKHNPFYHYIYHADLAYELGQVGRIAEAESAVNIALASPFASAYPEWSETRDEIEQKHNYPDLSRCFIDRSLTESEVIPDSTANLPAEAERATETKPVRASTLCRFIGQSIYQRPVTLPNAHKASIPGGLAQSFLQRLGRCIQPRAPPAY